jgi:hypothetical protein
VDTVTSREIHHILIRPAVFLGTGRGNSEILHICKRLLCFVV